MEINEFSEASVNGFLLDNEKRVLLDVEVIEFEEDDQGVVCNEYVAEYQVVVEKVSKIIVDDKECDDVKTLLADGEISTLSVTEGVLNVIIIWYDALAKDQIVSEYIVMGDKIKIIPEL